jgi:hypothetical protein
MGNVVGDTVQWTLDVKGMQFLSFSHASASYLIAATRSLTAVLFCFVFVCLFLQLSRISSWHTSILAIPLAVALSLSPWCLLIKKL